MPSDLRDLLDRAADRPSGEPAFDLLARAGRRRRHRQWIVSSAAVVAALVVAVGVTQPLLRGPSVLFDSGPRAGVGRWTPVPPSPLGERVDATAIGDDDRVVVFGGTSERPQGDVQHYDGAVYDLRNRTWTTFPAPRLTMDEYAFPQARLLDDGRLMVLVDGGTIAAAFYDFDTGRWESTGPAPLSERIPEVVEWTGDRLLVWGGWSEAGQRSDGAVWESQTGWAPMAPGPLGRRSGTASVWTGDRLLIWGGATGDPQRGEQRVHDDGAAYDPATDSWSPMPDAGLSARQEPVSVWTGGHWIVMGGRDAEDMSGQDEPTVHELEPTESCEGATCSASAGMRVELDMAFEGGEEKFDGARYDPAAGTWSPVSPPSPPSSAHGIIVLNERFVAYGPDQQALYDPDADEWRIRPTSGLSPYLDSYEVAGRTVEINSGPSVGMSDTNRPRRLGGVVFDDRAGRWDPLAEADTSQRTGAAVAAAGDRLFVWGGSSVLRDITQGYSGGDDVWQHHDDGAVLTLD